MRRLGTCATLQFQGSLYAVGTSFEQMCFRSMVPKLRFCGAVLLATALVGQNPPSRQIGKMIWQGRVVDYVVIDGRAFIDGDMSIDLPEEQERSGRSGLVPESTVLPWVHPTLWPAGVIPYSIDPDIPNPQRILDGIAEWNTKTPVRLIPRSNEGTYLRFVRNTTLGACFTNLSQAGGQQTVQTL